jgi:hypothetical protein
VRPRRSVKRKRSPQAARRNNKLVGRRCGSGIRAPCLFLRQPLCLVATRQVIAKMRIASKLREPERYERRMASEASRSNRLRARREIDASKRAAQREHDETRLGSVNIAADRLR